jgi:hypothetical protein
MFSMFLYGIKVNRVQLAAVLFGLFGLSVLRFSISIIQNCSISEKKKEPSTSAFSSLSDPCTALAVKDSA